METQGPEKIIREDVWAEVPEVDGTEIIVQRHEKYIADKTHPQRGSLDQEATDRSAKKATELISEIIDKIPEEEREKLDIMVIGSPTQYMDGGRRSMETAASILSATRQVFQQYNLSTEQILNDQPRLVTVGGPISSGKIVEPRMFTKTPEFPEWIMENISNREMNVDFWTAFENDEGEVRQKRLELGAEGTWDIADRLADFLYAMKRFSEKHHQKHPGRRLILWVVSHYDTISPFIKSRIGGGKDNYLAVDYAGGFNINIKANQEPTTKIGDVIYPLALVKASTASSID